VRVAVPLGMLVGVRVRVVTAVGRRVILCDVLGAPHPPPEVAVRPGVRVAVDARTVPMNVRVGVRHLHRSHLMTLRQMARGRRGIAVAQGRRQPPARTTAAA